MMSDTRTKGRAAWMATRSGVRRQGFQAVQDRLLPAGATGDRRWQIHPLNGRLIEGLVS